MPRFVSVDDDLNLAPDVKVLDGHLPDRLQDDQLSATNARIVVDGPIAGDNRARLQAAIDLAAASGKPLFIKAGTYAISASLTLPSGVTVEGEGPATKIITATGANCAVFVNADTTNGNSDITVRSLYADGNKANQTTAFSVLHFRKVTKSTLANLTVARGKRTAAYPVGNRGEGIELEYSDYNTIENIHAIECDYDGVKLRTSHFNKINNLIADDCGKGALQLAFVQGLDENLATSSSIWNTASNITARHSTGQPPNAFSPETNGITLHCASHNTISNVVVSGTQRAIATAGFDTSVVRNKVTNITGETRTLTPLGVGVGTQNLYSNGSISLMSGTGGFYIEMNGLRNEVRNFVFDQGGATGNWTQFRMYAGGFENKVVDCTFPTAALKGVIDDLASRNAAGGWIRNGNWGLNCNKLVDGVGVMGLGNAPALPVQNFSEGSQLYADGDGTKGTLKVRTPQGTVTKMAGELTSFSGDYTASSHDLYLYSSSGGGTLTVSGPGKGMRYHVKNLGATALTVAGGGGSLIDGQASMQLAQWASVTLIGTGTNWLKF
ncbi:hypothetical protein HWD94_03920 [Pseudarthrobacter equi]|uniref:right-handed parallel beta-helix repeat-containing protein n=1 Tax=Pseudarthrobacter equi TaxID=728066 RepID=UPI0021BE4E20|nr:right-handed parallel beta-helix repeat-containing protein [Pseudarthrobacter equi]MCT9624270.1 hypothetical protein [Pseudarthrobacter equi]